MGSATVVAVLAVISLVMAAQARHDRTLAISRQLLTEARAQSQVDSELSLLLTREAYLQAPGPDTEAALRQALVDSHVRATLPGDQGRMCGAAFSADGKHLVTSGADDRLLVWNWDTKAGRVGQAAPRVFRGGGCGTPVFSADGRRIAAAGIGGVVWVWDWASEGGPLVRENRGFGNALYIAFSLDGQRIAIGSTDGTIWIRDLDGKNRPVTLRAHDQPINAVVFSPDGTRVISSATDGTVRESNLSDGATRVVLTGGEASPNGVAFRPDGRQMATANNDGTVRVSNLGGGPSSVVLGSHDGTVHNVTYSADGRWIASTGSDDTIRIWNANHRAAPAVLRMGNAAIDAALSPDGATVVSTHRNGSTKIWDVDEADDLTVFESQGGPASTLAASPDGRRVASGHPDGTVRIWDITGNKAPTVLPAQKWIWQVTQVAFSPDGQLLAGVDDDVRIWKPRDPTTTPVSIPLSMSPSRIAFNPSGKQVAIADDKPSLSIWNTTGAGKPRQLSAQHVLDDKDTLRSVAWSSDGNHIAAASTSGTILLWDMRTRTGPIAMPGRISPMPTSLAFSPDNTRLVGARDTIHVWDIANTTDPIVLRGHQGGVSSVTFSADSHQVVTTGYGANGNDATIRIWRPEETREPLEINGFRAAVTTITSLGDNRYLSAHDDGTIRIWRCPACGPINEVLAQVDQHVTRTLTPEERQTYLSPS